MVTCGGGDGGSEVWCVMACGEMWWYMVCDRVVSGGVWWCVVGCDEMAVVMRCDDVGVVVCCEVLWFGVVF